ncbi:MAG: hypothetical protein Q4D93_03185 [Porphyromonas sp.]|nr:hypothetical protein [Porphyromonas sp.]
MKKNIEILRRVADQIGESPIDFYDHLVVAKQTWGKSPVFEKYKNGELDHYDPDKDPYLPACKYLMENYYNEEREIDTILELTRDEVLMSMQGEVVEEKEKKKKTISRISTVEHLVSEIYKDNISGLKDMRVYINYSFFESFFDTSIFKTRAEFDELIANSKHSFRIMLGLPTFLEHKQHFISYIESNKDLIERMARKENERMSAIYLSHTLYSKLEDLRSNELKKLKTSDIARGAYFLFFETLVRLYKEREV